MRRAVATAVVCIALGACGTVSSTPKPATPASSVQGTDPATPASLTALPNALLAINESIQLYNTCTVLIRCVQAATALSDATNVMLTTIDDPHAFIPDGIPASFDADVHQLMAVAKTLISAYQSGSKPSATDLQAANQNIATYNADLAAGGLSAAAAPTLLAH